MKKWKKRLLCLLVFCLCIILLWGIKIVVTHELGKDGLPVLGYHAVVRDDVKETYYANDTYVMSESKFKEQMKYLHDNNYKTLTMDEVYDYYYGDFKLEKKVVVLTFDDGYKNFEEIVKPILETYDLHATCFVIGEKLETTKHRIGLDYLQSEDLANDSHVAYYSHSYGLHHKASGLDRKKVDTMNKDAIQKDFDKSKNVLDSTYFAFPYGRSNEKAESVLKENNVLLGFGYNQNRNMKRLDNVYLLPRYLMFSQMPLWYFKWIVE